MTNQIHPVQRNIHPFSIFLATFAAAFICGFCFLQTTRTSAKISEPPSRTSSTLKFFLILVDDLNTPSPQLDSLWTISINPKLSNINFLEMSNESNWSDFLTAFSITQDRKLSPHFLQLAKNSVSDASGYILLDRVGASTILSGWIPDQVPLAAADKISSQQITALCGALASSRQTQPVHLSRLTENNHLIVDSDEPSYLQIWEALIYPETQPTCLALVNSTK